MTNPPRRMRKALALFLTLVMALTCFSAGFVAFASISGVPTRNDKDAYFTDPTLFGAEKWDKSTEAATLTFSWNAYSWSLGYDPQPGALTFTYPSHIYLNVGETLEGAGYMGHMTASYGENDGSDVTDFRVMLSSATWGESTRSGFSDVIDELISGYGHQGTCTEGSKIMTGSSSHYDFSNDGRGSDQIIKNKPSENEDFESDKESIVVWRSNIQWTGSDMNNFDEYVLLKGTANKTGEVTFDPMNNFTIGAAQRYTASAWHSDNGARLNRWALSGSRPQATPAEDALSITFTVYDKSELYRLIAAVDAGTLGPKEGQSQDEFAAALADARAVLTDREVTQAEIDAAANSIGDRMTMLVNSNVGDYTAGGDYLGAAANTFNAQAYHQGDPAPSQNVVYSPSWTTSWWGYENSDTYLEVGRQSVKLATPANVVMVYDGVSGHEPYAPIVLESANNNSSNSAHQIYFLYKENKTLYNLGNESWIGSISPDGGTNTVAVADAWNYWPGNYAETDHFAAQSDDSNNRSQDNLGDGWKRHYWWNTIAYVGTGNTTSYYDAETDPYFYMKTKYRTTGNQIKEGWPMAKTNYYTINYQPVYEKLADAAAVKAIVDNSNEVWKYTEASVNRVKATLAVMEKANPKYYSYGNVAGDVETCANYIADAVYMFANDGLTLVKKEGTVTFVNQTGGTLAINGQPATYTKEYGETIAANEIPALSNVYYRADNAQWDYGTDLSWSPAIESNSILVDEPEKIYQINDEQTVQLYTVTFYDDDGTTVLAAADWQYGDYPDYGGTVVKQAGTEEVVEIVAPTKQDYDFNYEVTGWKDGEDNTFSGLNAILNKFEVADVANSVRADLEGEKFTAYTAIYTSTAREDADYSAYNTALADAQAVLAIPGLAADAASAIQEIITTEIARAHDDQNRNYRSDDEDGVAAIATAVTNLSAIVSDYTDGEGHLKDDYVARYTVTWNYNTANGAAQATTTVAHGDTPAAPVEATAGYEDAENTYTFDGWTTDIAAATGDAAYTAKYITTAKPDADYTDYEAAREQVVALQALIEDQGLKAELDYVLGEADDVSSYADPFKEDYVDPDTGKTAADLIEDGRQILLALLGEIADDDGEGNYTLKEFTITWINEGETIGTSTVTLGSMPAHDPVTTSDEQYTYTSVGWAPEIDVALDDAEYTAVYDKTGDEHRVLNKYAVTVTAGENTTLTVKNGDAAVNSGDELDYGTVLTITAAPEEAYSQNDVTVRIDGNVYTDGTVTVTGATAIATDAIPEENINTYTVKWKNGDDVVGTATVRYGEDVADEDIPDIPDTLPPYDASSHFTYGWDDTVDLTDVKEDKTVALITSVEGHTLAENWLWADDATSATLTLSCACGYSDVHTEDVTVSVKSTSAGTCETPAATVYTAVCGQYTAPDKTIEGALGEHDYSGEPSLTRPVYDEATDTWSGGVYTWICETNSQHEARTQAVERADYSAFDEAVAKLETLENIDIDITIVIASEDDEGNPITLTLEEVLEEVAFILQDADEFPKDLVVTEGNDPADPLNEQPQVDNYVALLQDVIDIFFNADGTVKEELISKYTVTFTLRDGTVTTYEDRLKGAVVDVPAAPAMVDGYTFEGWTLDGETIALGKDAETYEVTGNAAFTAEYSDVAVSYVITWVVDGEQSTTNVSHDQTPVFSGSTDKADDDLYTYTFTGWDPEIVPAAAPATYTAQYSKAYNEDVQNAIDAAQELIDDHAGEYDDGFIGDLQDALDVLGDDTKTDEEKLEALNDLNDLLEDKDDYELVEVDTSALAQAISDAKAVKNGENAGKIYTQETLEALGDAIADAEAALAGFPEKVKASDSEATQNAVTAAVNTLNAAFGGLALRKYTVTWNVNGIVTVETDYHYGDTPAYSDSTDRADDALYTYTFTGWDPEAVAVAADADYVAQYTRAYNEDVQNAIDEAQELIDDHAGEYDGGFIGDLQDALDVLGDDTKTDEEKTEALNDLNELLGDKDDYQLVPVDTEALAQAISDANDVLNDPDAADLYTQETLDTLAAAVAEAQTYLDATAGTSVPAGESEAKQQEVAEKAADVTDALDGLVKNPADYTRYDELYAVLETLKDNDALTEELQTAVNSHYNNPLPADLKIDQQQTVDAEADAIEALLDRILEKDGDAYTDTIRDDALIHCTVTFKWKTNDGDQTDVQSVVKNTATAAPAAVPACYRTTNSAAHYVFDGWDKSFANVTADITVNAKYVPEAHSGTWTVVTAPTETEAGEAALDGCAVCGGSFTKTLPALGANSSDYRRTVTEPATCQAEGVMTYTWLLDESISFTCPIPKTDHQWGEWIITAPATEGDDGTAERHCAVCGETEYDTAINVAEAVTTTIRFNNISKMHYVIDLGEGGTFTVYNSAVVLWTSNRAMRFTVYTYGTFNFPDIIVYADGEELAADENGYYTVPASGKTVTISAAGAVQDDSAPNGKLSFWELLIRFFKRIIAVFTGKN